MAKSEQKELKGHVLHLVVRCVSEEMDNNQASFEEAFQIYKEDRSSSMQKYDLDSKIEEIKALVVDSEKKPKKSKKKRSSKPKKIKSKRNKKHKLDKTNIKVAKKPIITADGKEALLTDMEEFRLKGVALMDKTDDGIATLGVLDGTDKLRVKCPENAEAVQIDPQTIACGYTNFTHKDLDKQLEEE